MEDISAFYTVKKKMSNQQTNGNKFFCVENISDGQKYVLKFLKPKNDKERKEIKKEIGLHALSQHETVVKIEESFDFRDRIWTVMEDMEGGEFTSCLEGLGGRQSEAFCKYSLYKVLKGIIHLHSLNIIHRDIKSDNILVNS